MVRTLALDCNKKIGQEVKLCGWVNTRRDHGKLIFIDLRDRSGIIQTVADQGTKEVRPEFVIEIEGQVARRPKELVNQKLETGEVEVKAKTIKILNQAQTLPFPIDTPGLDIEEELRLKYRYLDLRRPRLTANLKLRHKVVNFARNWLDKEGFTEIETPILTKATPEGARDFLVPSRLQPGKFYALPQSPQQYKQLLMVAGLEKYYQIARCLRDEELRSDRQLEFTQFDLEMSFVTQDEILDVVERMFCAIVENFSQKKIFKKPFPKLTYNEVIKKYNSDKPDLRADKNDKKTLAFLWVCDFPMYEWDKTEKRWNSMHHPFTMPKLEHLKYLETEDLGRIKAQAYDLVCNGYELASGSIRIVDPAIQEKIFTAMGYKKEEVQAKFGHLLTAFKYGAPPMGGMAPSVDRFVMLLADEENIREVIAFPVSSSGQTAVMDAPSKVDEKTLKELKIKIK
ncbi:hypothetical protein A3E71_00835 [Candidatus Curtissbacteria bacterium RIFCSPHIGHO2_12_FULL_42_33]|nr:MAG: hypothetical protein A3E71_00835 [Candidatus Curtissbacteria bacterium RIFCSPHIGHO2_12_FULL_42_33]